MKNIYSIANGLYITSSEEIKEGDWYIYESYSIKPTVYKAENTSAEGLLIINSHRAKKIILSNNPKLNKDGVQVIPSEFLYWWLENDNCEEIEVKKERYMPQKNGKISDDKIAFELCLDPSYNTLACYKLVIPDVKNIYLINNNIYITNSAEIKEGDWVFELYNGDSKAKAPKFKDSNADTWWLRKMNMCCSPNSPGVKKIILTTDKKLIKDGVQSIWPDFIEWFAQNKGREYNLNNKKIKKLA